MDGNSQNGWGRIDVNRLVWANTHPGHANSVSAPYDRRHLHHGFVAGYTDRVGGPPSPSCLRNFPHSEWDDPTWLRATVDVGYMDYADRVAGVATPHDYGRKPMRAAPPPKPRKRKRVVVGWQIARPATRGLVWWDLATLDDDRWGLSRDDAYLFTDQDTARRIANGYPDGMGVHVANLFGYVEEDP